MKKWMTAGAALSAVVVAVATVSAAPLSAQEAFRVTGSEVSLYNLAGRVDVVRGPGPDVVVHVTRGGADAGRLRVEVGEVRGQQALRVIYPSDRIVYSRNGRGMQTNVRVRADGTFGGEGGERVTIRGSGPGLDAHANLRVEVPEGKDLRIHLAAGETEARGMRGDLLVDTGSGAVTVSEVVGDLVVDTGSGSIDVRDIQGEVLVDTGSGSVRLARIRGPSLLVDTGSGSVEGSALSAESVRVDTGSGSVVLTDVSASDIVVDTGSGSVELSLTRDVENLDVDTGSGSVTVRFSQDIGAEVEVETGSGGIDVNFPLELRIMRRNQIEGRIGDGRGRIRIDTGSGEVRLIR